jgi:tetratricopeptide (TPR) repeat protein
VNSAERDRRVPSYLGRVLDGSGDPVGTCFQVAPGVVATAGHVLDSLAAGEVGSEVQLDALDGSAGLRTAVVCVVDQLADLAVLEVSEPFDASVSGFGATDEEPLGRELVVTGVSEVQDPGHRFRFLDAPGKLAGGTTRDDSVPLGRMKSSDVMPGMSGAPVRRAEDDVVVGVVSGRYNSADGWLRDSVWIARAEQLAVLCAGMTELNMDGSIPTGATEVVLAVDRDEVCLQHGGKEVRAPHLGVRPSLVSAIDDVRRARARVGGARAEDADAPGSGTEVGLELAGRLLGESFLPGPVADALGEALSRAESRHQAVRLGVACEGDMAKLPWEALPDPRDGRPPLALNSLVSVYRRIAAAEPPPVPGPLRILVAISSPERGGGVVLDYEQELRNVLAAVRAARQGEAYVRIVPFATMAEIRAALEDEPVHILHLSGHGSPGKFVFEDDEGNARDLGPDDFVDEAIPPGRMPAVVALAACHTNVGEATGEPSFAARLIERGASVVIASETSVTDVYATRVFSRTYGRLADAHSPDPVGAVCDARRAVQAEFEHAADERERVLGSLNEWAALSVLAASGSVAVFDPDVKKPVPPPTRRFTIGSVAAREVGDFVGRRSEQRKWPIELVAKTHAGLVLHGIGGAGKTTLAAELVGRMLERGEDRARAVLAGVLTVDGLFGAVTAALRRRAIVSEQMQGSIAGALAEAGRSDLPWSDRLAILREGVLDALPLLVVLDNFESNLVREGQEVTVRDPALAELLAEWIGDPGQSRLLFTCRYPFTLPGSAEARLAFKAVGPLSAAETSKLVWSLPALDRLSPAEVERVWRLVGGHPRSLEYLDALLSKGVGRYPDITQRLNHAVAERLGPEKASTLLDAEWKLDDAIAEVATLAADDVLLEQLVSGLDTIEGARELLVGMSVYREPVDMNAALFQVGEPDESAASTHDRKGANERIEAALKEAGIDASGPIDAADLPPDLLAKLMPDIEEAQRLPEPPRAAPEGLMEMVRACATSSLLGIADGDAGPRLFVHRWTAGELERSASAAGKTEEIAAAHRRASEYWLWRVSVWPQDRRADAHDRLEARYHYLAAGEPERAGAITEQVCSQLEQWGAWDDEASLIHDTLNRLPPSSDREGAWIGQLGNVAYHRGNLDEAERLYNRTLEIMERQEDQGGMATSFHQLGMIAQDRGDLEQAEGLYNRSLEIAEELDDQPGIATSLHQLGNLARGRGDMEGAESLYRRSLEISERLGDQPGIAASQGQLGILAQRRGDLEEAERLYRRSLEIAEQLGDQPGIATSQGQLGTLAQGRGNLEEAEGLYRNALEIRERLGDLSGIATSYRQLGTLAHDRGDLEGAKNLYGRALEIMERMGDRSGIAGSYHQLGVLAQRSGDLEGAKDLYRGALEIAEQLEDQSGIATSYHQLGVLAQANGDLDEAEGHYRRSLEILERLGERGGIGASYHQLGMLFQRRGDFDEAESYYRRSLEIAEALEDRPGIAKTTSQIAILEADRGDVEKSIGLHGQALRMRLSVDPPGALVDLRRLDNHRESIGKDELLRILTTALGPDDAVAMVALLEKWAERSDG